MAGANDDKSAKFINSAIMLFTGSIVAIAALGFINNSINWTGILVVAVIVLILLVYRAQAKKKI